MASSYRKIDIEVRDEDKSDTVSYQKIRKDGNLTEKIFIKEKNDHKTVSDIRGTSTDGKTWELKDGKTVPYKEYDPTSLFRQWGFMEKFDAKVVGGGDGFLGWSYSAWVVIFLILFIVLWTITENRALSNEIRIANEERELWNNAKPAPTKKKELEVYDTPLKMKLVGSRMLGRLGIM
jgi:hypothetical protein